MLSQKNGHFAANHGGQSNIIFDYPMKKHAVLFPTVFGAIIFGLLLYFAFAKVNIYAQMSSSDNPLVSKTSKTSPVQPRTESAPLAGRFAGAATQNSRLRNTLAWGFGGKTQIGWNIYSALISQTIGTESSPDSGDFAAKLSQWQAAKSIDPTGILDKTTLEALVKHWQSQRLGRSASPGEDRLFAAPIVDFFDSSRSPDLLKLENQTYAAYKRMLAAAAKDLGMQVQFTASGELAPGEKFLRIVSAYRSPEYQAALRRKEPGAGRAQLAVNSPHGTGQALDLFVGGEPVSTKDPNRLIQVQTPAYKWLVKNAHKFGFYPYFYEPWHWEYVPGR